MKKKLKNNEIRVVKVSFSAVTELVWEYFMREGKNIFDLHDKEDVTFHMQCDGDCGNIICVVVNSKHNNIIKIQDINSRTSVTADSFFDGKIYQSYILD